MTPSAHDALVRQQTIDECIAAIKAERYNGPDDWREQPKRDALYSMFDCGVLAAEDALLVLRGERGTDEEAKDTH